MQVQVKPPMAVTNAVSWRSEGIKYKKNEVSLLLQTNKVALAHKGKGCICWCTFLATRRGGSGMLPAEVDHEKVPWCVPPQ